MSKTFVCNCSAVEAEVLLKTFEGLAKGSPVLKLGKIYSAHDLLDVANTPVGIYATGVVKYNGVPVHWDTV